MNKRRRDQLYTKLAEHIVSLGDVDEVMWFLDQLLTDGEIHDVLDRIRIFSFLSSGLHTQRDVAQLAEVSISKVIRGAAHTQSPKVRAYFSRHFPEPESWPPKPR